MNSLPDAARNTVHALKCELAGEVLRSSGKLRIQVTGWSMLPSVWPGDTLLIERISGAHVAEGDIVLFSRNRRLFAHRVVGKNSGAQNIQIITKGDGMPRPDAPVTGGELLGKVSSILRRGKSIEPRTSLGFPERAVAALVQRSSSAARLVVGVHEMRPTQQEQVAPCQS